MIDIQTLNRLNAPTKEERLQALRELAPAAKFPPMVDVYINNHIHTTYSFSPYSPTASVYAARMEGLCTAGIVDHDSIAGALEFIEAGKIIGMPVTVGMECRVSMKGTSLEHRRTNNPDQEGISYMTLQGVPHAHIGGLNQWFAPYREKRSQRTAKMTENVNRLLAGSGVALQYERDVLPLSLCGEGGGITERHLMYALANAMVAQTGKGEAVVNLLRGLSVELSSKQEKLLMDTQYPFYAYDLLGILKSAFIPKVYIPADEECPGIEEFARLAKDVDAIACYAYLGDVGESVTGDKKAQRFEDEYLDDLFVCLEGCGIGAVTYMPTRNTPAQLDRLRGLCERYGMIQVSGEDINSPRQSFVIRAMEDPQFQNLIASTWMLIAHENGTQRP